MDSVENSNPSGQQGARDQERKFVIALSVVVGIEALAVLTGATYFLVRMFLEPVENIPGAVVILLITLAIAVGLIAVTIACFRNKSWTRGAIVTWQVLQFAVATSFIQGIFEWQPVGWLLFLFSAAALVLVFLPVTTREMTRSN